MAIMEKLVSPSLDALWNSSKAFGHVFKRISHAFNKCSVMGCYPMDGMFKILRACFHVQSNPSFNIGFDISKYIIWNLTHHINMSGWRNPWPSWLQKTSLRSNIDHLRLHE